MSKGKRLAGGILLLALIALTFYLLLRNQPVSQLLLALRSTVRCTLQEGIPR